MKFKEAFDMVLAIHEQDGDKNGWLGCREVAASGAEAMTRYSDFDSWWSRQMQRTDISQDQMWEMECKIESFKVLFQLMQGPEIAREVSDG